MRKATAAVDKKDMGEELDRQMGRTMSQPAVDNLWAQGIGAAKLLLEQPHIKSACDQLEKLFFCHRQAGTKLVHSAEIYDAVRSLFPAEKLDLTDPDEDLSDIT